MPEARFTTGEFAALCGTTKATLFHYDKIGVLCPVRDPENNYRYYTDKQVSAFDAISSLTEIGTSLAEIRELWQNWDLGRYLELLDRKEKEMAEREERLRSMRGFLRFIREETGRYADVNGEELDFVELPAQRFAVGPGGDMDPRERRRFYEGTLENIRRNRDRGGIANVYVGSIVTQETAQRGEYFPSFYYCNEENAVVTGQTRERPAGSYARFFHRGHRRGIGLRIQRAMEEIQRLGWRLAGDIYVDDHLNIMVTFSPGESVFPIFARVERAEQNQRPKL